MTFRRSKQTTGFTLVELMMVVVIIGILAVLANYGVRKYIANAKSAEARNALGQMAKDAVTAFERDSISGTILAKGALSNGAHKLCPAASASIPSSLTLVAGHKYQSKVADWNADSATNGGFYCLKFSIDEPQYYMYSYAATRASTTSGTVGDTFTVSAQGDLDGNGVTSLFQIQGQIGAGYTILTAPVILEVRPDE